MAFRPVLHEPVPSVRFGRSLAVEIAEAMFDSPLVRPVPLDEDFHIWEADWTADKVTVSIDGVGDGHDRLRPSRAGGPTFDRIIDHIAPLLTDPGAAQVVARITVTPDSDDLAGMLLDDALDRRKAITDGRPGSTRDRNYAQVSWQGAAFELIDTGVFDDGRYWIVEVTYAKASPTEILCRINVTNHGAEEATLHVLPTLWFRNTWRWSGSADIPELGLEGDTVTVHHPRLDGYRLQAAPAPGGQMPTALFCDNETNARRLYGSASVSPFPKDGINDHVVSGAATVNPASTGTKAASSA